MPAEFGFARVWSASRAVLSASGVRKVLRARGKVLRVPCAVLRAASDSLRCPCFWPRARPAERSGRARSSRDRARSVPDAREAPGTARDAFLTRAKLAGTRAKRSGFARSAPGSRLRVVARAAAHAAR